MSDFDCIYAVGDIHGRLDLLEAIDDKIRIDATARAEESCAIVYLGDYIDRGPHSAEVLSYLAQPPLDGLTRICLKGNHEQRMLDFMLDPRHGPFWVRTGGKEALESFGIMLEDNGSQVDWSRIRALLVQAMTAEQLRFLLTLDLYYRWRDYLFVHAGIRRNVPLDQQDPNDLLNIREPFSSTVEDFGFRVIHGHDSRDEPLIMKNRVNVDTKAWASDRLTCAVLSRGGLSLMATGH